jgi:DMSO/TMAO reductase YedYZ heme-binding membrane subunit
MNNLAMWRNSIIFSLYIYVATLSYTSLFREAVDLITATLALALTGGILIGCSFALSIMSFFFDFLDSKLKYRKEIGVLGYFYALAYSLSLLQRFPEKYIGSFPNWLTELEAMLGLTAMAILTMMTIISTKSGVRLAGRHFRPLLRLGYIAYLLLVIRAWLLEKDLWLTWLGTTDDLAPPRLLLSIFALTIIISRLLMEIVLRTKRQTTPMQLNLPSGSP